MSTLLYYTLLYIQWTMSNYTSRSHSIYSGRHISGVSVRSLLCLRLIISGATRDLPVNTLAGKPGQK